MDAIIAPFTVPLASADGPPGSGTPQYATNGTSAAGYLDATDFPAYHYNSIVRELLAVLAAGAVTPDRTVFNQLSTAIGNIAKGTVNEGTSGYQIFPSGLIVQWGGGVIANNSFVTFPLAFPNACWRVLLAESAASTGSWGVGNPTLHASENKIQAGFTHWGVVWAAGAWGGSTLTCDWLAVGF